MAKKFRVAFETIDCELWAGGEDVTYAKRIDRAIRCFVRSVARSRYMSFSGVVTLRKDDELIYRHRCDFYAEYDNDFWSDEKLMREFKTYFSDDFWLNDFGLHEVPATGRPKMLEGGKRVNVYLDSESLDRAQKLGLGNVSEGIRIALKRIRT